MEQKHIEQEQTNETFSAVQPKKRKAKEVVAGYFTPTRIAYIGIFTAIAYVLYLFDFPILPSTPVFFLELDFSNAFVMIGGFTLGPVAGVIIAVLKELIHALTVGHTMFVGELANILFVLPYMLIPAIVYKKHKGLKTVIITLILGCLALLAVCIPVNYLLNFPAFYYFGGLGTWQEGMQLTLDLWYWVLLFNGIKVVLITVVTLVLYKPLSRLIKATNAKFGKMRGKKSGKVDNGKIS